MSILGIGTDIIEIQRLQPQESCQRLAKRILTCFEYKEFTQNSSPDRYLAKKWVAKEAAAKALGTGIASGVTFKQFEITHEDSGQPRLTLNAVAKEIAVKKGVTDYWISLSDEQHYAIAMVVLSG